MFKKIRENKVVKFVSSLLYALLVIVIVLILLVVALQRFSNNNLTVGGFRIFNIVTGSMLPKYQVGDVLVSKSTAPSEIKVGDDIVYKGDEGSFSGKIVTHQVISVKNEDGKYVFQTKGLANDTEDPEITEDQVYGKIIYKMVTLSFLSKIMEDLYSFYFVVFIPVAFYIVIKVRSLIIEGREEDDDEEDEDEDKNDEDTNQTEENKKKD